MRGQKNFRMVRWEDGRCLVLFKGGGGCRLSPRFLLLFLMLIKGRKRQDGFKIFRMAPGMERLSLHLLRIVRNIICALEVGCECVWNLQLQDGLR